MKTTLHTITLSVLSFALVSCELTGDPDDGGILWSEAKALQRQAALQQSVQNKQSELSHLEQQGAVLRSRKAELQKEIKNLKKLRASSRSPQITTSLTGRIEQLENELQAM